MTTGVDRAPDASAWGLQLRFRDARGGWQASSSGAVNAALTAMSARGETAPPPPRAVVMRAGERRRLSLSGPAEVQVEQGGSVRIVDGLLPRDLPLGYHEVQPQSGGEALRLIVAPPRCHLPVGLRTWGWAAQLYALRSRASWGIGDLGDLRELARWSAKELGAGMVLVNPLHAAAPALPQQASPYFPSSRLYRNPLYLRIEEVPGAAEAEVDLGGLARAGHALNRGTRIDRDAVFRLKMDALQRLWVAFGGDPAFVDFRREGGASLETFAAHCTLAERHGADWRTWPAELRHPAGEQVGRFQRSHAGRIAFHIWLQWLLDRQLEAASRPLRLIGDLAVGFDPGGADAWMWQDALALDISVGAPPDEFNPDGQDWELPPFDPWRLRAAGYGPFIETLRAAFRHAGGLRVDHVMGLFRLYWRPRQGGSDGVYVRYPADDLLGILALESVRAEALVVGEDLGTVEPAMRRALGAHDVLSYRLLWFEEEHPRSWPAGALAAVTTHDLPTIAGLWTGADLSARRQLGLAGDEAAMAAIRERLARLTGCTGEAAIDEVVRGTHAALGWAPSALLAATLEDLLAVRDRPNMPGAAAWPNWSIPLPWTLEEIRSDPRARRIAGALRRRGGG